MYHSYHSWSSVPSLIKVWCSPPAQHTCTITAMSSTQIPSAEEELHPALAPHVQMFPIRHAIGSVLAFDESSRVRPGQLVMHDASNPKAGSKASLRFHIPENAEFGDELNVAMDDFEDGSWTHTQF